MHQVHEAQKSSHATLRREGNKQPQTDGWRGEGSKWIEGKRGFYLGTLFVLDFRVLAVLIECEVPRSLQGLQEKKGTNQRIPSLQKNRPEGRAEVSF